MGGTERHFSVWNGLKAAGPKGAEYVAVHDAARPLITPNSIEACLEIATLHGASACAAPVSDTLKRVTPDLAVSGSVERNHLWAMQTPQIFLACLLERAYERVLRTGEHITDEVSAVQQLGISVILTRIDEPNFKITLPCDLDLARLILENRKS